MNPLRLASTSVLLLFAASIALAQTLPPPRSTPVRSATAGDPIVELSPFVISEAADTGWIATETLAGTRLRTDFKDVPNQIETLTKDFMQDLGLTSFDQALIYTANVENASDFVPATPGSQVSDPGLGGRIRGIGSGTLSRNFFKVSNPTDNFNIERATVASGPNAILFGLGSPAGILDASPARALMRNRYGFELQYDSENSKRGTFDANVVVLPQKLAVRLMGLSKREYTEKRPNLDRDERLYGALTFKPFKGTTLVLQGERDSRRWNRAGRITPNDASSIWFRADQIPGSGYTVAKPVFDNTNVTGLGANRIFFQAGNSPIVMQDASVATRGWGNSVAVRNPAGLPGVDPTFDAGSPFTILDPKFFPFDVNIVGTGRANSMGAITKTVILEQKLADNFFLELAYNREDATNHKLGGGSQSGNGDFALSVDPNRYLPGTTTLNPNTGLLYYQFTADTTLVFSERDDWRATLSYELDLARKLERRGGWTRWLGRHRLSGLYTGSKTEDRQGGFQRRILDNPTIPGLTLRPKTFSGWAIDASRLPVFRHYFRNPYDPKATVGSMTGDMSLLDANGQPYTLYLTETPLVAADGKRLAASGPASGSLNRISAQIFAWQGFFLPDREHRDRLVLTYGYRKDSAQSATLDSASITQDFSGLHPVVWDTRFDRFGATQSGINRSLGIVARPLKWVSVFYNKSTTFDLNIGRYDPFGNDIPGAGGDGRDYGIRLDLWRDKLSLRLNKYENALGPQRASNQINLFRPFFFNVEQRVLTLDPSTPTINVTDGNRRGYRVAGQANYFIMSDFKSEGYEVELNFAPTHNWNLRLNGAKSEAVESNIGGPWFEWTEARLPVWQAVVAKNGEVDSAGRPVTWKTAPFNPVFPTGQTIEQYYNNTVVGQGLSFMTAADGRATATARGARANAITTYRFTEGRLKGFHLGGAVRWRSAPTIGYGVRSGAAGTVVLDLDKAYEGVAETYVDLTAGYRGKMKPFGGFNYRIQLNVRNALNKNDPIPIGALTTGEINRIATIDSRLTLLTFAVEF